VVAATQPLRTTAWVWVGTVALVIVEANGNNQPGISILVTVVLLVGDQVRRRRRAQRELADQEERSDAKGLFCLPCPAGRRELTISATDRESVRYPLRMESGQAHIRITMPPAH